MKLSLACLLFIKKSDWFRNSWKVPKTKFGISMSNLIKNSTKFALFWKIVVSKRLIYFPVAHMYVMQGGLKRTCTLLRSVQWVLCAASVRCFSYTWIWPLPCLVCSRFQAAKHNNRLCCLKKKSNWIMVFVGYITLNNQRRTVKIKKWFRLSHNRRT